jgi:hypothetical protein
MRVIAIHNISDPERFEQISRPEAEIPEHLRLLMSVPSHDLRRAVCLWEGASVAEVQEFLDSALAGVAVNECIEAHPARAVGVAPESAVA